MPGPGAPPAARRGGTSSSRVVTRRFRLATRGLFLGNALYFSTNRELFSFCLLTGAERFLRGFRERVVDLRRTRERVFLFTGSVAAASVFVVEPGTQELRLWLPGPVRGDAVHFFEQRIFFQDGPRVDVYDAAGGWVARHGIPAWRTFAGVAFGDDFLFLKGSHCADPCFWYVWESNYVSVPPEAAGEARAGSSEQPVVFGNGLIRHGGVAAGVDKDLEDKLKRFAAASDLRELGDGFLLSSRTCLGESSGVELAAGVRHWVLHRGDIHSSRLVFCYFQPQTAAHTAGLRLCVLNSEFIEEVGMSYFDFTDAEFWRRVEAVVGVIGGEAGDGTDLESVYP